MLVGNSHDATDEWALWFSISTPVTKGHAMMVVLSGGGGGVGGSGCGSGSSDGGRGAGGGSGGSISSGGNG